MIKLHKPSQKRFKGEFTYFVTFKTLNNYPYFKHEVLCELFVEELRLCKEIKKFKLHAFCILYDHVHLLITPEYSVCDLSGILHFLKRHVSRNTNSILFTENEVGQPHPHKHEPLVKLSDQKLNFLREKLKNTKIPKFKWLPSFHDHYIRNLKDYQNHYNYTVTNHFKHNLSTD